MNTTTVDRRTLLSRGPSSSHLPATNCPETPRDTGGSRHGAESDFSSSARNLVGRGRAGDAGGECSRRRAAPVRRMREWRGDRKGVSWSSPTGPGFAGAAFESAARSRRTGACFCSPHHPPTSSGHTDGCAGTTSGFRVTGRMHARRLRKPTRELRQGPGLRWCAPVGAAGPGPRSPASRNWVASGLRRRSPGPESTTTDARWRHPGNAATSGASHPIHPPPADEPSG